MSLILSDTELLERVRSGDAEAFQSIAERYAERLGSYFHYHGVADDVIPDLMQSTLMRFLEVTRRHSLTASPERSVEALLFLIARRTRWDHARRDLVREETLRRLSRFPVEEARTADEELGSREALYLVRWAVFALPEKLQEVIVRHYLDEEEIFEIAFLTGTSQNTIKKRLRRARELLHAVLAPVLERNRP